MSHWIQTHYGRRVDVFNPSPADFDLRDIAVALSNTCRFSGHVPFHYSVGQHSLIMSYQVPRKLALEALMHDAAEAYMGDVPAPIKRGLVDYRRVIGIVEAAIADCYKLDYTPAAPQPWPDVIHKADMRMVMTEAQAFGKDTTGWGIDAAPYGDVVIGRMTPENVKMLFLHRFVELMEVR